ncbi:BglG family transcription antiterminator [Alkalibacillus aidingensis]|uniref:BglG family transcription antiterminator n=1 Tax=Alkalibacillus aidingensis TaxID=2747607 RepID=UPI001660A086|nr:HTH domain-containing protein [Alkalibacillus aidingensis]
MVSDRQRRLIEYLLQDPTGVRAKELASYFQVTERTIRNDLASVKDWAIEHDVTILHEKGRWQIDADPSEVGRMLSVGDLVNEHDYIQSPLIRQLLITFYLLTQDESVSLKEIAEEFYISKGTVVQDIKKLEEWLGRHLLQLNSSSKGYLIEGDEMNIRVAMYSVIRWLEYEWSSPDVISKLSWTNVTQKEIEEIQKIVTNDHDGKEDDLNLSLFLVSCLTIQLERVRGGHLIEKSFIDLPLHHKGVISQFVSCFGLGLTSEEEQFHTVMLHTMEANHRSEVSYFDGEAVHRLIESIFSKLGIINFSKVIEKQIQYEVNRVKLAHLQSVYFYPPIYQELKQEYQYMFNHVKRELINLDQTLQHVPKFLLSEMVMLFASEVEQLNSKLHYHRIAVVCPNGVATSHLLASRIKKTFTNIEIIGVFSLESLRKVEPYLQYDFIISTVHLDGVSKPFLTVKPLIDEQEAAKIERFMEKQVSDQEVQHLSANLITGVIPDHNVKVLPGEVTLEDAFWHGVQLLVENRSVNDGYFDDIREVYVEKGPYFEVFPGLLMPHAHSDHVHEVDVSLVKLEHPVILPDGKEIHGVLTLATPDTHSHLPLMQRLHYCLTEAEHIQDLFKMV